MGTNLSIAQGLQDANTVYTTKYEELYGDRLPGPYAMYTEVIPNATKRLDLNWLTNHPVMRKWLGARQLKSLRHYDQLIDLTRWEATLPIERVDLQYDNTGAVGRAISNFLQDNVTVYDREVVTEFDSNAGAGPTGFDGVALYSAAHPHAFGGGTQSNLSAGTNLSQGAFDALRFAMRLLRHENGEPAAINPTHMRVGPKLEQRAKEILESKDRVVAVNAAGGDSGTRIAASTITNVWAGELTLIVDQRVTGFFWDVMDLSHGTARPMIISENRAPEAIIQDDLTDDERFNNDRFLYGLEADFTPAAGHWLLAQRATGTA